jgi:MHS family proline/betaine transporter-like MFS transporter
MHTRRPDHPVAHDRRALVGACLGNAIEWYDFAVYGAMASVLAVVLLPPGSGTTGSVTVFAVFASSFLARPVGAVLVGLRADRLGPRGALATMVLTMSVATAAIGLLLPWSEIGIAAPLLLLCLRLVQGFCSGGEISSSISFLVESAPRGRWGRYGGWHIGTVALGIASGIGVAGVVSGTLSSESLEAWGWRLPFLVALPLGLVGLYVRLRLQEPAAFATGDDRARPTLGRVWRDHGRAVRTGFVLVAVLAATLNMWFVYLPTYLVGEHIHPLPVALACAAGGLLATAAVAPPLGALSDRIGRRALLFTGTSALFLLVVPLYLLATQRSWFLLLAADVVVGTALGAMVVSAHLAESFPVTLRATGIALTFGLATAAVGGTAPLLGSLFTARGAPIGIPLYLAALSAAGAVAALSATRGASPDRLPATGDAPLAVLPHGEPHADNRGGALFGST